MRYLKISIHRNELCTFAEVVAAHELPILQHIHGEEQIQVTGEMENDNPWPRDAAAEYTRLEQRYGKVENTDTPNVAAVYGVGTAAYRKLAVTIQQAYQEAKANPIDYEAIAAKAAEEAAPKVAIDYDAPEVDALSDEQLAELDAPIPTPVVKPAKAAKAAKAKSTVIAGGAPPIDLAG